MSSNGPRNPYRRYNKTRHSPPITAGSALTVAAPPKQRHGVTSLQGLDLSVTLFFCPRRLATHPVMGLGFKCDALIRH